MATGTLLSLNCWVIGDDSAGIFPVEIDRNKNVGCLKEAIKEKMKPAFDDITANSLQVWKVSIPVDEDTDLEAKVNDLRLREGKSLWALKGLHSIFTDLDNPDALHVVVGAPPISERRRFFFLSVTLIYFQVSVLRRRSCDIQQESSNRYQARLFTSYR